MGTTVIYIETPEEQRQRALYFLREQQFWLRTGDPRGNLESIDVHSRALIAAENSMWLAQTANR